MARLSISLSLAVLFGCVAVMLLQREASRQGWLGIAVESLAVEQSGGTLDGVRVVRTVAGGPAEASGLRTNDILRSVNSLTLSSSAHFEKIIGGLRPGVVADIYYTRGTKFHSAQVQIAAAPEKAEVTSLPQPIVQVKSSGHHGRVNVVRFLSDGKRLLSAGDDKTVRLWDLEGKRQIHAFRTYHAGGKDGQMYALDVEPGERFFAASGHTFGGKEADRKAGINLVDIATGETLSVLRAHLNSVNSLRFSKNGKLLASAGGDGQVLIWDVAARKVLHRIEEHTLLGVVDVAFDRLGRFVYSFDMSGGFNIWSIEEKKSLAPVDGLKPAVTAMAVADNADMAVLGSRGGELIILDLANASIKKRISTSVAAPIAQVAIAGDKTIFFSYAVKGVDGFDVYKLDTSSEKADVVSAGHTARVSSLALSADGAMIATNGFLDRSIAVNLIASAQTKYRLKAETRPVYAVGFSLDGLKLSWGYTDAGSHNAQDEPLEYAMQLPTHEFDLGSPEALLDPVPYARAITTSQDKGLRAKRGGPLQRKYGELVISGTDPPVSVVRQTHNGYEHTAYSFYNFEDKLISGGRNGVLEAYDLTGKKVADFKGHNDVVWSVALSRQDRFVASSGSDHTVRLWNAQSGELVASFLRAVDGEWVMWLPQGFFYGSAAGGKLIGWQLNKGANETPDFVSSAQYRQTLNRRDLLVRALQLASAEKAVQEAFPAGFDLAKLLSAQPPQVRLAKTETRLTETSGLLKLSAFIKSDEADLKTVFAFVNGTKVHAKALPSIRVGGAKPPEGWLAYDYEVPLFKGSNTVELVAVNDVGSSPRGSAVVHVQQIGEAPLDARGALRVVAVGVNEYGGLGNRCGKDGTSNCDLQFASTDAESFAIRVAAAAREQYDEIKIEVLSNSNGNRPPTRENILSALDALAASKPGDTVLVFLAGHGEAAETGRYFFLPTDVRRSKGAAAGQGENLIDWLELQNRLTRVDGRRILFVDACQAANAGRWQSYNNQLAGNAEAEELVAYVAAGRSQASLEHPPLGHGLFTYSVLEAIEGTEHWKERFPNVNGVKVHDLASYLSERVRKLSDGSQVPETHIGVADFVLLWR